MKPTHFSLVLLLAFLSGCAYPISQGLRDQADPSVTFVHVLQAPETYVGKTVVLGGVIAEVRNLKGTTEIEVVEKTLDYSGYPSQSDQSLGRFVFRQAGLLDPEIYSKGREVTGAGTLVGVQKGKIGESDYDFPVIEVVELKLWEEQVNYGYYDYSPFYFGYNWGPYRPYPYFSYGFYGRRFSPRHRHFW